MPSFRYRALDERLAVVTGNVVSDTPFEARIQLRDRNFTVLSLGEQSAQPARRWQLYPAARQTHYIPQFSRDMASLLGVGVPLLEALDTVLRQQSGALRLTLIDLREQVAAGQGLAEAMARHPRVFDDLVRHMVEVGEHAGTLDEVLLTVANHKDRAAELKGRVATALIYPVVVVTTGAAVSVFLMTFVVPTLLDSLVEAGRPLPLATRIVKGMSDGLIHAWWMILLSAAALIGLVVWLRRFPRLLLAWHHTQLRLPILGDLFRKQALARVLLVLSSLLESGIDFLDSLRIAQRSSGNLAIRRALNRCEAAIGAGAEISVALDASGVFPPAVVQVVAVGQQAGQLDQMLRQLAENLDRDVAVAAGRATAVLEPVLIIGLALFVALVAFATVQPIMEAGHVM